MGIPQGCEPLSIWLPRRFGGRYPCGASADARASGGGGRLPLRCALVGLLASASQGGASQRFDLGCLIDELSRHVTIISREYCRVEVRRCRFRRISFVYRPLSPWTATTGSVTTRHVGAVTSGVTSSQQSPRPRVSASLLEYASP